MSRWKENDCVGCPQGCINCGRKNDYYVFECDRCGDQTTDSEKFIHDGDSDYCRDCWEDVKYEMGMKRDAMLCKAIDDSTHDWVEGSLVIQDWNDNFVFIIEKFEGACFIRSARELLMDMAHIINKDTICRCTGCRDTDGELIYEHDICEDKNGKRYVCRWIASAALFEFKCKETGISYEMTHAEDFIVKGNEYDDLTY